MFRKIRSHGPFGPSALRPNGLVNPSGRSGFLLSLPSQNSPASSSWGWALSSLALLSIPLVCAPTCLANSNIGMRISVCPVIFSASVLVGLPPPLRLLRLSSCNPSALDVFLLFWPQISHFAHLNHPIYTNQLSPIQLSPFVQLTPFIYSTPQVWHVEML